jgi:hypothetical protein
METIVFMDFSSDSGNLRIHDLVPGFGSMAAAMVRVTAVHNSQYKGAAAVYQLERFLALMV